LVSRRRSEQRGRQPNDRERSRSPRVALGIAQHFVINGQAVLIPMAIEEPSVIAGVSFMAKLAQAGGGFHASASAPEMIGQIQLLDLPELAAAEAAILSHKDELLGSLHGLHPSIEALGGGAKDLQVRQIASSPIGSFLVRASDLRRARRHGCQCSEHSR